MIKISHQELVDRYAFNKPFATPEQMQEPLKADAATDHLIQLCAKAVVRHKATALVLYVNEDLGTEDVGAMSVLCVGPTCTYKTAEEAPESLCPNPRIEHPRHKVMWCEVEEK